MKQIKNKSISDVLAFLISVIFSPYIVALTFIIIIIYRSSQNINEFLPWMITFTLFGLLIPGLYVIWLTETGVITDIRLSKREERRTPFIFTGISSIIGTIILTYLNAEKQVVVMALTYSINAIAVAIITQFWKISVHMTVLSSIVTITVILYGIKYWWLYLILIPVAWARIHRKRHTLAQTIAGTLLAFTLTLIIFGLFGYL